MRSDVRISDLRDVPQFRLAVADRVWRTWWRPKGVPFEFIERLVGRSLDASAIPFALVAHSDGSFRGTVSLVTSDLHDRPSLTPWLAALFVEPEARGAGTGSSLVAALERAAYGLGSERLYLAALPERHAFYARLGWRLVDAVAGGEGLAVFVRTKSEAPASDNSPDG